MPLIPSGLERYEPMLVLANEIRDNVLILNEFISTTCHPPPTFSADSVPIKTIIPPTSPEEVQLARSALISSARTLLDLALGPVGILEDLSVRIYPPRVFTICTSLTHANVKHHSRQMKRFVCR